MNIGQKLIIIGIVLLFYWAIVSYAHDTTLEAIFVQSPDNSTEDFFVYPLWWPLTVLRNYAGWAGFILIVVGAVKAYMSWRFIKNEN